LKKITFFLLLAGILSNATDIAALKKIMRFIIHAKIPTEPGNKIVEDPNFPKNLEDYMNEGSQKHQ
jgi:hypothetical protein